MPANTPSLEDTLAKGVWTPVWRTSIVDNTDKNPAQAQTAAVESEWQVRIYQR